jgi:hypothetical protein
MASSNIQRRVQEATRWTVLRWPGMDRIQSKLPNFALSTGHDLDNGKIMIFLATTDQELFARCENDETSILLVSGIYWRER